MYLCRLDMLLNKVLVCSLKRLFTLTFNWLSWLVLTLLILLWFSIKSNVEIEKTDDNPVIVWWTEGFPGSSKTRQCDDVKCEVLSGKKRHDVQAYLFYGSNIKFHDLPLRRDKIWGLYHEESPRNVAELMHESILKLFNFSSTYSRFSDVPFPLQYLESIDDITNTAYFVETHLKNVHLKEIAPILYLQSDCDTSSERDLYVQELMKFAKVDSYGTCLNNKKLPEKFIHDYLNNLNDDDFLNFVARYKFVIAIENGVCEDYITEKFWRAIKVGVVPIYFGSPTIRDWFPNEKSAILIQDYPTPKILNDHINKLLKNDDLYEDYLEHKTKKMVSNVRLIEEFHKRPYQTDSLKTVQEFECFVCKKLHDQMSGNMKAAIVDKKHYNCSKPISALTLSVNPKNSWVYSWEYSEKKTKEIFDNVIV